MRVTADLMHRALPAVGEEGRAQALDVRRVYDAHAPFVWASLQRMGVAAADLEDVLQDVFLVVHKRLHTFDGSSKLTTWLFGVALNVAAAHRRRAFRRREDVVAEPPEPPPTPGGREANPEHDLVLRESRRRVEALLDELDVTKRAVFVMFEIDELPCEEIADMLGVPVGTVYSRLHAARRAFQQALARMQARDAGRAR